MAKYGQFTGYEPAPEVAPDAYRFTMENGQPFLAGGDAAAQLKARLDAANSATMVAGDKAAPGFQVTGLAGRIREQGVKAGQQELAKLGGTAPEATPASPPVVKDGGFKPFVVNGINTGYMQGPDGQLYEQTGGRAAVTKEQLEKSATEGVAIPTAESKTVAGGFAPNQEYLEGRSDARIDSKLAMQEQQDAELQAEAAGQQTAREQFAATTGQMTEQQRLVNEVQAQVAQAQDVRNQALKEYTGSKVDPERIFHGEGGFAKKGLSALASALGAFGASINHSPNFAQQIIDRRVAQDVGAQEADIRIKKDASDTALADLMRRGMTLDQAKNTLGTIQRDYYKQQMAISRGASNSDVINAKYDAAMAQLDQQALDDDEKYRQQSLGTATTAVQAKVVQPQAGSAGGYNPLAPGKALSVAGSTAGTEGQVAGTAKTVKELSKGAGGGDTAGLSEAQKKAVAEIDASLKGLADMEKADADLGHPTIITTGSLGSDASQKLGAMASAVGPGVARATEGDAATKDSMNEAKANLVATTGDRRKAGRAAYKAQLETKRQAILDGKE